MSCCCSCPTTCCCYASPADAKLVERDDFNPIENRKCRDILWLLIFGLSIGGAIILAQQGNQEGDLDRLKYGISSANTLCGGENETGRSKLMYCFNGTTTEYSSLLFKVCVPTCPTSHDELVSAYNAKKAEFEEFSSISPTFWEASNYTLLKTLCVAPSVSVLNRCLYDFSINTTKAGLLYDVATAGDPADDSLAAASQMFMNSYNDIVTAWYVILVCGLCGGLAISFLWLELLKFFAAAIVWFTVGIFVVALAVINYLLALQGGVVDTTPTGEVVTGVESEYEDYYKYLFYVFMVGTIIIFLILIFMFNRIRLAIALIRESASVVRKMPQLMMTPVIPVIVMSGVFVFGIFYGSMLASTGDIVDGKLEFNQELRYSLIFFCFVVVWVMLFILGLHNVTMAGAVAEYYWTRDKADISRPVSTSLHRALRFHMGSIAFASFILNVIKFIKWAMMYISRNSKKYLGTDNPIISYILKCLACCIWCVEKFVQFLTKNAYILIAVEGEGFCVSAGQAWSLIMSNIARMTAVNVVSAYLFFLSRVAVGALCALVCTLWVEHKYLGEESEETVTSAFAPSVCAFILGYFVAWMFYEVVDFTVDTLLLCFCLDDLRNSQTGNYYASPRLIKLMASSPKMKAP